MQLLVVAWAGQQQHKGSWQAQHREGILSSGVSQLSPLTHSNPMEPDKPLWPPQPGPSRAKHIQGQLWSWSLIQKLSAQTSKEMSGFSAWLHSLLWADRGWQNSIFFRGKSPFIFSACFQLPHLMMLHALCCWWGPGPHPMGMALIQGPKRALEHGQGGHHIPKTAQSQGEQGSPPSAPCELGWSL